MQFAKVFPATVLHYTVYWCAASVYDDDDVVGDDISDDDSDNDNGNRTVKHWESLMHHLCNVHDNCYHMELSSLE